MIQRTFECSDCPPPSIVYTRTFDGLGELADLAQGVADLPPHLQTDRSSVHGSAAFTGTPTLKEAIRLSREGWPEGRHQLLKNLGDLAVDGLRADRIFPELRYDTSGEDVDVARYLSGIPENMMGFDFPPRSQGNVVELIINSGQAFNVKPDQIMRRGAVLVAAVQALEGAGYSIGVTLANALRGIGQYEGRRLEYYVPVLSPGQYFDVDALIFALAHPSYLRRLIFTAIEEEPTHLRTAINGYYGRGPGYGVGRELEHIKQEAGRSRFVIESDEAMAGGLAAAQSIIDKVTSPQIDPIGRS